MKKVKFYNSYAMLYIFAMLSGVSVAPGDYSPMSSQATLPETEDPLSIPTQRVLRTGVRTPPVQRELQATWPILPQHEQMADIPANLDVVRPEQPNARQYHLLQVDGVTPQVVTPKKEFLKVLDSQGKQVEINRYVVNKDGSDKRMTDSEIRGLGYTIIPAAGQVEPVQYLYAAQPYSIPRAQSAQPAGPAYSPVASPAVFVAPPVYITETPSPAAVQPSVIAPESEPEVAQEPHPNAAIVTVPNLELQGLREMYFSIQQPEAQLQEQRLSETRKPEDVFEARDQAQKDYDNAWNDWYQAYQNMKASNEYKALALFKKLETSEAEIKRLSEELLSLQKTEENLSKRKVFPAREMGDKINIHENKEEAERLRITQIRLSLQNLGVNIEDVDNEKIRIVLAVQKQEKVVEDKQTKMGEMWLQSSWANWVARAENAKYAANATASAAQKAGENIAAGWEWMRETAKFFDTEAGKVGEIAGKKTVEALEDATEWLDETRDKMPQIISSWADWASSRFWNRRVISGWNFSNTRETADDWKKYRAEEEYESPTITQKPAAQAPVVQAAPQGPRTAKSSGL